MPPPPNDPISFQFFNEIGIIEQLSRNLFERILPEGMSMAQFTVLNHLVRLGGGKSPLRLARAMQVTKGAMTNTLQRLETRGAIKVTPDPTDGRGKLVDITPAGRALRQQCLENALPLLVQLSEEFIDQDFQTALPFLRRMRVYLDENSR